MKIPNKGELQKLVLNHSSDINSKDFIKVYKNCTAVEFYCTIRFWLMKLRLHQIILQDLEKFLEKCNIILTEKLPKYQPYHLAKLITMNILLVKTLPSNQEQIKEQAKSIYSP